MPVNPSNSSELANIAREVGAEVIEGDLTYPSPSGGWQVDAIDLSEYLARFKDKKVMLILAPVGDAEEERFVCGICGFAMNSLGECPRCKLHNEEAVSGFRQRALFDEVRKLLGQDD